MAFTTWTALRDALRDSIATRDLSVSEYRTPDGTMVKYRTFQELVQLEAWASTKAEAESASANVACRRVCTVASSGGAW